jgi:hypothetical protein
MMIAFVMRAQIELTPSSSAWWCFPFPHPPSFPMPLSACPPPPPPPACAHRRAARQVKALKKNAALITTHMILLVGSLVVLVALVAGVAANVYTSEHYYIVYTNTHYCIPVAPEGQNVTFTQHTEDDCIEG